MAERAQSAIIHLAGYDGISGQIYPTTPLIRPLFPALLSRQGNVQDCAHSPTYSTSAVTRDPWGTHIAQNPAHCKPDATLFRRASKMMTSRRNLTGLMIELVRICTDQYQCEDPYLRFLLENDSTVGSAAKYTDTGGPADTLLER